MLERVVLKDIEIREEITMPPEAVETGLTTSRYSGNHQFERLRIHWITPGEERF